MTLPKPKSPDDVWALIRRIIVDPPETWGFENAEQKREWLATRRKELGEVPDDPTEE